MKTLGWVGFDSFEDLAEVIFIHDVIQGNVSFSAL